MNTTRSCIIPDIKKRRKGLQYFNRRRHINDDDVSCEDDGCGVRYACAAAGPYYWLWKKLPGPQPKPGRQKPLKTQG